MAVLGIKSRAALRRFEQDDVVRDVAVHHDRVRVQYTTNIVEIWGLLGERKRRLTLPRSGWWSGPSREELSARGYEHWDLPEPPADGTLLPLPMRGIYRCSFLERRLRIQRLVAALLKEGWFQPSWHPDMLKADTQALLCERRRFVLSKGFALGQPGRAAVPPPGFVLANHLVDWGRLGGPGRVRLAEAWADPRRLYWAIEGLVRRRQPVTRVAVIHRLVVGTAEGFSKKAGIWSPPSLWVDVLGGLLDLGAKPILCDPYPGCGSRVVAALALGGVVIAEPRIADRAAGAVAGAALRAAADTLGSPYPAFDTDLGLGDLTTCATETTVVPDDGSITSDVGIIDLREHDVEFDVLSVLDDLVERCASVLVVSDGQRDAVLNDALPGADRIRFRPRPWSRQDDAIFVFHQRG